jgi:tetratricopeptide (TPR) repeat protein
MNIEDLQDRIQDYICGKMSPKEKAAFEKQIAVSEALSEEVNRFRQLRIITQNKDLFDAQIILKSVMAAIEIEPDYGESKSYFKNSLWKWICGGFVVVAVTGGIFLYPKHQEKRALSNLAKTHLQPLEILIGFAPNDPSPEAKGMQAYERGNYEQAIPLLSETLKNKSEDHTIRLYLAISYLMQEQHAKAEIQFQEILKTNDLSVPAAQWYLALSLIQRGEKEAARTLLQNLESNKSFGKQAKLLLKDL